MDKQRLGRTGLTVSRSGFGAIPIQRIPVEESTRLLRKAYEGGITFFDTAHGYTDSEEKIGLALSDVRKNIVIATKSPAADGEELHRQLDLSLERLRTDWIDIYQLHNPAAVARPGGEDGLYDALIEEKRKGRIRFIGFTNHRLPVAREAVESGLYDTIQFPLSSLASEADLALLESARERDVGFIAMKALSGGLITKASSTFAYLRSLEWPLPIWGIEKEWQLEEFLELEADPPTLDDAMRAVIAKDRAELSGSFCRGCGYCMPCPVGIEINTAARITFLMRRSRYEGFLAPEWRAKMDLIESCQNCGQCRSRCPYELDTPMLLKAQLKEYRELAKELAR
jgi:aryl-alcohol dehydrogenase-like predicted oxidoreductase